MRLVGLTLLLGATVARADDAAPAAAKPGDDGYCDYVQGAASAQSALSFAPELFGQFGYVEQSPTTINPDVQSEKGLRFIGGLRYSLTGFYMGTAIKSRAKADCRRHVAFEHIRGETEYRALEARLKVLEAALDEADKLLAQSNADLEARRTTAQEGNATRIRVDELRRLAVEARSRLRQIPAPGGGDVTGAVRAYQQADDDMEASEAKIRRAQGLDISIRAGVDSFLDRTENPSPFFAVVSASVNLGVLFQSSGNERAAAGRRRLVRSGRDPISVEATTALLADATRREADTATLESDLKKQLDALNRIGGDDSRRYRLTLWFDYTKVRAEHAYHAAHVATLKQLLGGGP